MLSHDKYPEIFIKGIPRNVLKPFFLRRNCRTDVFEWTSKIFIVKGRGGTEGLKVSVQKG